MQKTPNWTQVIWFVLIGLLIIYMFQMFAPPESLNLSYSDFKDTVIQGQVSEITIKGDKITGTFTEPVSQRPEDQGPSQEAARYEHFETVLPSFGDPDLIGLLEKNKVTIKARSEEKSWVRTVLAGLLPWLLLIGFFVYTSKKFQERAGGGLFGFGKSKAKLYTKATVAITYEDVAGLSNTKKELQEVVDFLKDPSRYRALGGQLPKGILLVGPPGTGKTLMARATAGEANVPFFSISGSEFIEMFVGVGASRVRDMFNNAKKEAPSIIFIDELDSIGRVRGTGLGGGHDEREQTLNQILSEMDGFSPHESVVVIAATNRPDVLDPALTRPGRFDRQITLELPQKKARKEILELHTRDVPLADDVDLGGVADGTVGFSGADLKNLVNEAALLAARREKSKVEAEDFDQGRDKIILGIEREEMVKDEEKRAIAYHEAGHAMIAKLLPGADPLKKVSIIPRGRSLGATEQVPEEDRHNLSRQYVLDRLTILLGGRAAEKLCLNDVTSGAGDDLKKAPFLGREIAEQRDFSEATAQIIDEEIRRITQDMEKKAEDLLGSNRDKLDVLVQELLEHETLSDEDIDKLLNSDTESSQSQRRRASA